MALWAPGACGRIPPVSGGGALIIQDNPNWRRFRHACPYYRERWSIDEEAGVDGNALLYQIICLQNTPPVDQDEQDLCMRTRTLCWRLKAEKKTNGRAAGAAASARSTQAADVP